MITSATSEYICIASHHILYLKLVYPLGYWCVNGREECVAATFQNSLVSAATSWAANQSWIWCIPTMESECQNPLSKVYWEKWAEICFICQQTSPFHLKWKPELATLIEKGYVFAQLKKHFQFSLVFCSILVLDVGVAYHELVRGWLRCDWESFAFTSLQ